MKKPYVAVFLLTISSLFGAQSSGSSSSNYRTTPSLNSLITVITPLWRQVDATLKGPSSDSQPTPENLNAEPFGPRNNETEQKLREQLSTAFEDAWQKHEPQDAQIAALKNDIKSVLINFFIENEFYQKLEVCYCISPAKRIGFAVLAAQQLMQKFPNPQQKIIITAFASGLLLQEYLLLQLLTDHGYTHLTANFVDFGYPDPVAFRRVLNQIKGSNPEAEKIKLKHYKQELIRASGIIEEQPTQEEPPVSASSSDDAMSFESDSETGSSYQEDDTEEFPYIDIKQQQREWIKKNKELFPEFAELFGNDYFGSPLTYQKTFDRVKQLLPNVTLYNYKNAYDYIHFVQKYPKHKADMLSIVDPDLTVFDVAPFPSQANLLGLVPNESNVESKTPEVFIVLAKDLPVQLYVQESAYTSSAFIAHDVVEKIRKKILKTGSDKKLSYAFRNWLIKFFGSAGSLPAIKELLEKNKVLLEQAEHTPLSPAQTQQIFAELASVHENIIEMGDEDYPETMSYPTFSIESATRESALNYINNLQTWLSDNLGDAFTLVWYSDPHLAFQELVKETAKDDALIYLYYKYNTPGTHVNVRFEEETKPEYITKDVFGPIVGTELLKNGAPSSAPFNPNEPSPEPEKFARVDLQAGSLETWDDIKQTLPGEKRSVKDALEDYAASIANDDFFHGKKMLNLNFYDISSLDGLDNIPNIEEIQILYLNNNQLKEIPARAFSKFKNLERIFLDENAIELIPDDAFEGLSKKPLINSYDNIGEDQINEPEASSSQTSHKNGWSRLQLNIDDYLETVRSGTGEEKQRLLNKFKNDPELMSGLDYGYHRLGDSRAESIMAKLGLLDD